MYGYFTTTCNNGIMIIISCHETKHRDGVDIRLSGRLGNNATIIMQSVKQFCCSSASTLSNNTGICLSTASNRRKLGRLLELIQEIVDSVHTCMHACMYVRTHTHTHTYRHNYGYEDLDFKPTCEDPITRNQFCPHKYGVITSFSWITNHWGTFYANERPTAIHAYACVCMQ